MKRALRPLGLAVVLALVAPGTGAAELEVVLDLGVEAVTEEAVEEVDFSSALQAAPEEAIAPAAICRMRPLCDVDADCDAACGTGLGDCVRAKCPIRVCRC